MARHIFRCPMRWSDMDAYRHINNVALVRYLEEARVDWLFHASGIERRPNEGLLVVRNEIDYRRQLDYRHAPVPIELWVSRLGSASFTISYEVVDVGDEAAAVAGDDVDRVVYAEAKTVLACVDMQSRRPMRLSQPRKEFLAKYAD